jgi:hypothetical protein
MIGCTIISDKAVFDLDAVADQDVVEPQEREAEPKCMPVRVAEASASAREGVPQAGSQKSTEDRRVLGSVQVPRQQQRSRKYPDAGREDASLITPVLVVTLPSPETLQAASPGGIEALPG